MTTSAPARNPRSAAPFLFAGAGRGVILGCKKEAASLSAQVKEDGIERGLNAWLAEAERVTRFVHHHRAGPAKKNVLRNYERSAIDQN